ncbi:hypothetical protein HN51_017183 [Arachis hypogaea]
MVTGVNATKVLKEIHTFMLAQLKKATNNYDDNLVVGRRGFGTVYKGLLENDKDVAIKKSKTVNPKQVEQFINEIDASESKLPLDF